MPVVALSATKLLGLTVKADCVALGEPAVNVTPAVAVAPPAVAVIVFASALVAVRVVTYLPLPSVVPLAPAKTSLPLLLANDTDCDGTMLLYTSFTEAVTVAADDPFAMTLAGEMARLVYVELAAPAVLVRVVVTEALPTSAVIVFVSAFVVLIVVE